MLPSKQKHAHKLLGHSIKLRTSLLGVNSERGREASPRWVRVDDYLRATDGYMAHAPMHAVYLRLKTHAQNVQYLSLFRCNCGCTNSPECYVVRTYIASLVQCTGDPQL